MESPHLQTFFPWFFYEWISSPSSSEDEPPTIANDYLDRHVERITEDERAYILANRSIAYGFWEVMECEPGRGFRMKNVFFGAEADVQERMGSMNAQIGDILFCRVVPLEEFSILNGCGSFMIPPRFKPELIKLRSEMRRLEKTLSVKSNSFKNEIRGVYWDILKAMAAPPKLTNTHGEPVELHEMVFDIDSPDYAFDQLKSLCVTRSTEELLQEATRRKSGEIQRIDFDWTKKGNPLHKTWGNTILGNIRIDGNSLTVSVNSRKRAEKIRREIESRLNDHARFLTDRVQSMDSLMKSTEQAGGSPRRNLMDDRELYERPEVRELMRKQMEEHWKNWLHQKLDVLGNKTPLQAVKTLDGREILESMFRQMERDDARQKPWMSQKEYIDRAKRELGLE